MIRIVCPLLDIFAVVVVSKFKNGLYSLVTFAVDTTYQITDDCIKNSSTAHELIDFCVCGISLLW